MVGGELKYAFLNRNVTGVWASNLTTLVWIEMVQLIPPGVELTSPEPVIITVSVCIVLELEKLAVTFCAWLIAESLPRLEPAKVYDSVAGQDIVHETRTNSAATFGLGSVSFVHLLVQARMAASSTPVNSVVHAWAAAPRQYSLV